MLRESREETGSGPASPDVPAESAVTAGPSDSPDDLTDAPPPGRRPRWRRRNPQGGWAPDPERRPLPGWLAALLALGSGALLVPAFPPHDLWYLAPVSVALLAAAVHRQRARRGAWLGLLHGVVFFTWLLHWTGIYVGSGPWLALSVAEGLYVAALGAVLAGSSRLVDRYRWAWPLVIGAAWVAQEAFRGRWPFGGFPWGRLAFAETDGPLLRFAAVGGAPLVTFVTATLGGVLLATVWRPWRRPSARWVAGGWVAGGIALLLGAFAIPLANPDASPDAKNVTVAVVQGNVPRLGLEFNAQRRAVLDNHVAATLKLAAQVDAGQRKRPDLVIWPENSSDIDPLQNEDAFTEISEAAAAIKAPILVGAVLNGPGDYLTNAGLVWVPGKGVTDRYAKRHPVPFGEYVPLRSLARKITKKVDLVRRDFKPGTKVGAVTMPTSDVGAVKVGDVICFEVAYDSLVTDTVNAGAQLLAVQTNNATFGLTGESAQQVAMAQLRAVEHGRWAVVASTSGISATIGPNGKIHDEVGLFRAGTLIQSLALSQDRTLATALGQWPELSFCVLCGLGLVGAAALRRRRSEVLGKSDEREG